MKKVCVYIILLSFLFIGIKSVDASICTYSEQAQLNQKAAKIKVVYEEATGILDPSLYDCQADNEDPESCNASYNYFVVSILNMTEDFYITVQNNINNKQKTYYYSDAKDGMISFDWEEIMNIAKEIKLLPKMRYPYIPARILHITVAMPRIPGKEIRSPADSEGRFTNKRYAHTVNNTIDTAYISPLADKTPSGTR